jgi:O-glycosyl hydrolase
VSFRNPQKESMNKIVFFHLLACVTVAMSGGVSGWCAEAVPAEVRIDLDLNKPLQTIDGFGACSFAAFEHLERGNSDEVIPAGTTYKTTPQQRSEITNVAVRELGVSHARLWVFDGVEEKNDNDNPRQMNAKGFNWAGHSGKPAATGSEPSPWEVMFMNRRNGMQVWGPFLKQAVPLGLKNWIATPSELPAWMRTQFEHAQDGVCFEEYAEWITAHLLYLKNTFGLEVPYLSLMNEVDHKPWISPELCKAWIKVVGRRLRQEGLKTRIAFPDFMDVQRAVPFVEEVLKDEDARQYLGALAYHHYRSSGDGPEGFLESLATPFTAENIPTHQLTRGAYALAVMGKKYGLPSWQTETGYYGAHTKKFSGWEIAVGRANEIHLELIAGAAAVQAMDIFAVNAIDPRDGTSTQRSGFHIVMTTDGKNVSKWEVTKDTGAVFAHYGRFVRPGDVRVVADSSDALVRVTAFHCKSPRRCVAVLINNAKEPRTSICRWPNLPFPSSHAQALLTDATRTLAPLDVVRKKGPGESMAVLLPASSLVTVVWSEKDIDPIAIPAEHLER